MDSGNAAAPTSGGAADGREQRALHATKRARFLNPRFGAQNPVASRHGAAEDDPSPSLPTSGAGASSSGAGTSSGGGAAPPAPADSHAAAMELVLHNADILKILFSSFPIDKLCQVATTCRRWHAVCQSDSFWRSLDLQKRSISRAQTLELLRLHPNISSLNLAELDFVDAHMLEAVCDALPGLVRLELGHGQISEQQLGIIGGPRMAALRELTVREASFGRFGPGEVAIAHEHLTSLVAEGCRAGRLVVRCGELRRLVLRNSAISALVPHCPMLTHLDLKACSKISDSAVRTALGRLPALTHLDLSANLPLSDDTLKEVATRCTDLTSLNVSSCIAVSLAGVAGFPALRSINLSACDSLTPAAALPVLDTFTALEEIVMDSCSLLTQIALKLPRLQLLTLLGCRSLESVKLKCPALQELRLGPVRAGGPGCGALRAISVESEALESIAWRAFPLLADVTLRCPNLTSVDLSDCDSLKHTVFDSFWDGVTPVPAEWQRSNGGGDGGGVGGGTCGRVAATAAALARAEARLAQQDLHSGSSSSGGGAGSPISSPGSASLHSPRPARPLRRTGPQQQPQPRGACSRLRTLRMDCCEGLQEAALVSTALTSLSLAGCKGLARVALHCPALTELRLDECDRVEAIDLGAVGVGALALGTCPALSRLTVAAPALTSLDLKGCGLLDGLSLSCPALTALDATFCGQLSGPALAATAAGCPALGSLTLSVCTGLGTAGLAPPRPLASLTALDLSYTEVETLQPVLAACPALSSLNLASCASLEEAALLGLFPPSENNHRNPYDRLADAVNPTANPADSPPSPAARTLRHLDVSYCPLSGPALAHLLAHGSALESLALSGCRAATDAVWALVNGGTQGDPSEEGGVSAVGRPHALLSLAAVGCKGLTSCALGLEEDGAGGWRPCWTALSRLRRLRLGLSGLRRLAVALPELSVLDVSGCRGLGTLELRCPLLLQAFLAAAGGMRPAHLAAALAGCAQLELLDARHMDAPPGELKALRGQLPSLRCLMYSSEAPDAHGTLP
eukprot:jgi/Tetstr1/457366/TSEL_043969.t1